MKSRRAGSALIEFAGSLVIVSALFTGIFQFGYALSTYQSLVHSVRAGARYASLQPPSRDADLDQAVRNVVVYGDPAPLPNAQPVAAGLTPNHVELVMEPGAATVALRGFELSSLFSKIRLDGRPSVTFPRATAGSK